MGKVESFTNPLKKVMKEKERSQPILKVCPNVSGKKGSWRGRCGENDLNKKVRDKSYISKN